MPGAIANIMRLLCLERVLDFDVNCVEMVGAELELVDFTAELLRVELSKKFIASQRSFLPA
jgi:hypothetical protein